MPVDRWRGSGGAAEGGDHDTPVGTDHTAEAAEIAEAAELRRAAYVSHDATSAGEPSSLGPEAEASLRAQAAREAQMLRAAIREGVGVGSDVGDYLRTLDQRAADPVRPGERSSTWWHGQYDRAPDPYRLDDPNHPAPFDPEQAKRVPDFVEERGYRDKARGVLTDAHGQPVWDDVLASGADGPADEIGAGRLRINEKYAIITHVEAHAAAEMRRQGIGQATLYINRQPCPGPAGCEEWLPDMIPPEAKLTVYGPGGYGRVVIGKREEQP